MVNESQAVKAGGPLLTLAGITTPGATRALLAVIVSYEILPIAGIARGLPDGRPALVGVRVKPREHEPRHKAGARGCNRKGRWCYSSPLT